MQEHTALKNPQPEPHPADAEVCAIVVTFHPDEGLPERLRRVISQVGATIVVDNGSGGESSGLLRELSTWPGLTLITNADNLGIARALNIGVEQAMARGFSWALLLDQDSQVEKDMVGKLQATRTSFPPPTALPSSGRASVTPAGERSKPLNSMRRVIFGRKSNPPSPPALFSRWPRTPSSVLSGTSSSSTMWTPSIAIRARALGYRVIETREPLMSHSIGAQTRHRVGWSEKWTTNHSADRRYYIARNNTVLLREYGTSDGGSWRVKSVVRCFRLCKRVALFEDDKWAKLRAIAQGWWDGMRGNLGPRRRSG